MAKIAPKCKNALEVLKNGGLGVMPTDTIYGLVGSALDKNAVARIYKLRRRNPRKPTIILIGSVADLEIFGVRPEAKTKRLLRKFWPGRVSIIMQMTNSKRQIAKFKYLHRGTKALAFRLPKPKWLRKFLAAAGPLVAPSANHEGEPPAKTIKEAKAYFGGGVDFYLNGDILSAKPSRLLKVERGKAIVLRE